jgi:effector-binding domain-containing protein
MNEPKIVELPDRAYVGLPGTVTMETLGTMADRLPEVLGWLVARGVEPEGAPFFRYNVIDMERELEVEVGWPVAATVPVEGELVAGVLPGGRYVSVVHVGHYEGLYGATDALLKWAHAKGLAWDRDGDRWGGRLEIYHTNPAEQPDSTKWETELQFRLAEH